MFHDPCSEAFPLPENKIYLLNVAKKSLTDLDSVNIGHEPRTLVIVRHLSAGLDQQLVDLLDPGPVGEEPGLVLLSLFVKLDDLRLQAVHLQVQLSVVLVHSSQVFGQLLLVVLEHLQTLLENVKVVTQGSLLMWKSLS